MNGNIVWYSSDTLSNEQFVCAVFVWLLGREPDSQGLHYYMNQLMRRQRRELVLAEIANSSEANGRDERQNSCQLAKISRVYRLVRNLPLGQMRWWFLPKFEAILLPESSICVGGHEFAAVSTSDMPKYKPSRSVRDIICCDDKNFATVTDFLSYRKADIIFPDIIYPEVLAEFPDEIFIRFAYQWLLGRTVDPEGIRIYKNSLAEGVSRMEIIESISKSEECAKYLERGNAIADTSAAEFPFSELSMKLVAAIRSRSQVPISPLKMATSVKASLMGSIVHTVLESRE